MISYNATIFSIIFCGILCLVGSKRCSGDEQSCVQSKAYSFRTADCFNKSFSKFPKCLNTNLEVLDISLNRLRKISADDLENYSDLKILYLHDNMISKIDDDAFDALTDLQVLDISLNGFYRIPPKIFELPNLKKLYLGQNENIDLVTAINNAVPIKSPLEYLDINNSELNTLPNLGILSTLLGYNISGNHVENITLRHFSGLCNLEHFANIGATISFDKPCDCWTLQKWFEERTVAFSSIECDVDKKKCPYNIPIEEKQTYEKCKKIYEQKKFESSLLKVGITIGVIALALFCTVIYCYIRKYRPKQNPRTTHMPVKTDKLQAEDLL